MNKYKPPLTLSLNPTYYCNLRCSFCYLTEAQLADKHRLELGLLAQRLDELQAQYEIEHIDLYGGEVFLLPRDYLEQLKTILHARGLTRINLVTNLTVTHPYIHDPAFYLTVSYDGHARERHQQVFEAMRALERPFSLLMLASPEFLTQDPLALQLEFAQLAQLQSVELKPYSENQANQHGVPYRDFERWVREFIDSPLPRHYSFTNEQLIRDSLAGRRNAYSDDHLYLTPQGEWAVLEFDAADREYFLPLADLAAYRTWTQRERTRVTQESYCGGCEFLGRCLSEHLRPVADVTDSCNGFYQLLKWAQTRPEYQPTAIATSPVRPNEPVWRQRMRAYHAATPMHSDELSRIRVVERPPCWDDILEYLTQRRPRLIYPAKSIAVAAIYAHELRAHYGGSVWDYVTDPDLFIGTDRYYTPYSTASPYAGLYHTMFDYLARTPQWRTQGWVVETLQYFRLECLP